MSTNFDSQQESSQVFEYTSIKLFSYQFNFCGSFNMKMCTADHILYKKMIYLNSKVVAERLTPTKMKSGFSTYVTLYYPL